MSKKNRSAEQFRRAPLVWHDPSVPPELREAWKPIITDEQAERTPPDVRREVERVRQDRISTALQAQEEKFQDEVDRFRGDYAQGAVDLLKPFAKVGMKVNEGRRKGHEQRRSDKKPEWESWQREIDALHKTNPRLNFEALCKKAAKKFPNVKPRSLRRRCRNPRTQKPSA